MGKSKSSGFEALVNVVSKLPWWVGVVFAILSYSILHRIATAVVERATSVRQIGAMEAHYFIKTLAVFGQYIVPLAMFGGAAISLFARRQGGKRAMDVQTATARSARVESKPKTTDIVWDEAFRKGDSEQSTARPKGWSLDLLSSMEWKRFEDLSAEYYRVKGIRCETTSLGADGGIDLKLFQDDSGKPTTIVQCKAWGTQMVGVKPVRELRGVMASEGIEKGFFMTSGTYSKDAKAFAAKNRITLIDATLFLMMIKRLPPEAQERLLNFATQGDYTIPTCPSCGIKMVRRDSRRGAFWGCRNYPRCKQILHIRRQARIAK